MANYYARARSSYFKVKDPEAFKAWAKSRTLEFRNKSIASSMHMLEDPRLYKTEAT